ANSAAWVNAVWSSSAESADPSGANSTMRLPLHEAGARAGRLALGREPQPPGGVAMVRAELMARASTAPPRG
ncbi:hypothetical protein ACWEWX_21885, partial [Streptomyces asiaticus]